MKKTIALILCVLLVAFAALPAGAAATENVNTLQAKFRDGTTANGGDYVYYSPVSNVIDTKHYPLIVFLHGEDVGATPRSQLEKNGFWNYASAAYQARFHDGGGCFLLAPRSKNGVWKPEDVSSVKGCIDRFVVQNQANIDTKRIYVIGYSKGADFVWDLLRAYPTFFAGAIPAAAILQPDESVTSKLQNTAVWLFCCDVDVNYTASTYCVRKVFKNLQNATYDLSSLRLTAFSNVLLPNGEFILGSGTPPVTDTHSVWYAVTNDMHMSDGRIYFSQTTMDGSGKYLDLGSSDGVIEWLSRQTLEGAKSYDVPDEVRVPFSIFAFILGAFTRFFQRLFGWSGSLTEGSEIF